MWVLGLTGSIGMGKSATAGLFRAAGISVHDADATVHRLYRGKAAALVEAAFPGVVRDGAIDRPALSARVLGDGPAMKRLESIIHPLVREEEKAFLAKARAAGARMVVLDVPLLFETGGFRRVHAVAVVSAAADIQRARVLARPGMDEERFALILARQMSDADKRRRAHFIIDTGRGFPAAAHQVAGIVRTLAGPGRRLPKS